jgi:hypothetical protein
MLQDKFIGVWSLVPNGLKYSYSDREVSYPFGLNAKGQIIYMSNNQMSAQIMNPDRKTFRSNVIKEVTPKEAVVAFKGYMGYYGTYELDEKQGIVIHHVKGSYFPNWVGQDLKRYYVFSDDKLILTTFPVQTLTRKLIVELIWERIN